MINIFTIKVSENRDPRVKIFHPPHWGPDKLVFWLLLRGIHPPVWSPLASPPASHSSHNWQGAMHHYHSLTPTMTPTPGPGYATLTLTSLSGSCKRFLIAVYFMKASNVWWYDPCVLSSAHVRPCHDVSETRAWRAICQLSFHHDVSGGPGPCPQPVTYQYHAARLLQVSPLTKITPLSISYRCGQTTAYYRLKKYFLFYYVWCMMFILSTNFLAAKRSSTRALVLCLSVCLSVRLK